jgi:hypothetical protein
VNPVRIRIERVGVLLVVPLLCLSAAKADDVKGYIGKSSCKRELWRDFSIRLDKNQDAYIATRDFKGKALAMIVQYERAGDKCGIVRDIVESRTPESYFHAECVDPSAPTVPAIGTFRKNNRAASGYPIELWRLDLPTLKFVPVDGRAKCINRNYAGNDNGDDLAGWAKQRATYKKRTGPSH